MSKPCVICGKNGFLYYPFCKEHLEMKQNGEIVKCENCGNKNGIEVRINGQNKSLCPKCLSQLKCIYEFGYRVGSNKSPDAKVKTLYFKVKHPEYFGNADAVKISYTYTEGTNMSDKLWVMRAKMDLITPILQIQRDEATNYFRLVHEYLTNETSKYHEEAWMYYDSLVPITEKEYETNK